MVRLAVLVALLFVPAARAAEPDPLRFVPASVQAVVKVENPRKLADAITTLDAFKQGMALAPVKAVFESANARRALQLLAHVETELGAKWPELLDQVAGGGVAVALRIGSDPAPVLLVSQGKSEKAVAKAFDLGAKLIEEELARQGVPGGLTRQDRDGIPTVELGKEFTLARVGSAVFISNNPAFLADATKLARSADPNAGSILTKKSVQGAKAILPNDPLAWAWLDLAAVKQEKQVADFLEEARKQFALNAIAGGTIDCVRRADFVAAGLYQEKAGFRLAVRMPAGRDGFPPEVLFHVPPKDVPGSLPLLEPAGVVYSQSFYLDIGHVWKNRAKVIDAPTLEMLEKAEKDISRVIPGSARLGDILEMWGPHHRVVVATHDARPYKTSPGTRLPAVGFVTTMRDPKFGTALEGVIRAAGVLGTLQFGLKLIEDEHDGVTIVAFRFPENKPLPQDPDGLRFNAEPCFCVVGDQAIFASTIELCKKLIPEVKRTAGQPGSPLVWRAKGFASSAAGLLDDFTDPLVTDAILRGGTSLDAARKDVADIVSWAKQLGTVRLELDHAATEFKFDLVWEGKK